MRQEVMTTPGQKDKTSVITVAQLNTIAGRLLEGSKELSDVWVSGEVSNLTKHGSGHYYFTLKDDKSEIRCTFFRNARIRCGLELEENMKVLALGSMGVYIPKGNYQFNVTSVKADGVGQLFLAYEALRKKLESEGLFAPARKRALPQYPRRVGVVTSPTGAAIRDILNITARRFPADILLAPAQVQGEGAAASIVKGITSLNAAGVDIIIVGRGGGSLEDLWAFNEESVARAIYASRVPVVSAVGHETDTTIADFVADLRAPTPSAAAELVLRDRMTERKHVDSLMERARAGLRTPVERMRGRLEKADATISERAMRRWTEENALRLDEFDTEINRSISNRLDMERHRLNTMRASLVGLNPLNVLERGYAVVQSADGKVISSISMVRKDDLIKITLKDGSMDAQVKGKREKK
jgi:exodeoxyribonuclease VII large subunit